MEIDKIFVGQVHTIEQISNKNVITSHFAYKTILYQLDEGYFDIRHEQAIFPLSDIDCVNEGDLFVDSNYLIPYEHFSFAYPSESTKTLEELQDNLAKLDSKQKCHTLY